MVSGVLSRADGAFTLTTETGRRLTLVQGQGENTGQFPMIPSWAVGFGDGPMTFRGTFDGAGNFAVSSGAPGIHSDYVWSRVVTNGNNPTTGDGQPIVNQNLIDQVKALPRLGIVLVPTTDGRKWWEDPTAPAQDYYALGGRWAYQAGGQAAIESRGDIAVARGDFAWSAFVRAMSSSLASTSRVVESRSTQSHRPSLGSGPLQHRKHGPDGHPLTAGCTRHVGKHRPLFPSTSAKQRRPADAGSTERRLPIGHQRRLE